MSYNSGTTSITGSVSVSTSTAITLPGTGQTLKTIYLVCDGTSKTFATVTAGKTAYVFNFIPTGTANAAVTLRNDGDTLNLCTVYHPANGSTPIISAVPLGSYASGQAIKVNGPATSSATIVYVEV